MAYSLLFKVDREPWNKGKKIGQKPPLKLKEIWAIRIRLQPADEIRIIKTATKVFAFTELATVATQEE